MGKVDLHIHTTASDGKFTPAEIVRKAQDDRTNLYCYLRPRFHRGCLPAQEAASSLPDMTVIGGVEINTDIPSGELHILGYFCDCDNPELKATLERLRNSRIERAQKMVNKLRNMGIKIDFCKGPGTGRNRLHRTGRISLRAMLEKGYISTFKEAFDKYISRGGPAYVERDKITPAEATH